MSKKGLIARASALLLLPAAFAATAFTAVGCGDDAKLPDAGIDAPPPAPASLSMTPPTGDFASVIVGSTSQALSFTVTNTGGSVSGSISAIASGAQSSDFNVQTVCNTLIASGTCIVTVTFTPAVKGAATANLVVAGSPGGTVMASLNGIGIDPGALTITPSTHAFGDQINGTTSTTSSFTVTNTGGVVTGTLTVSPAGSDPSQFVKSADTCNGMTLMPALTCTFSVAFSPTSLGAKSASFDVTSGATGNVSAAVTGNSLSAARVAINPSVSDFGSVQILMSSANVTFSVGNTGGFATGALTAPVLAGTDAGSFTIVNQNCTGLVLMPNLGNSCNIVAKFSPTTAGPKTANLSVTGTPGGTATASLTGAGLNPGNITIAPSTKDYGATNTGTASASQVFTVTNGGAVATAPLTTALSGTNPGEFQVVAGSNGCAGTALAALASCTVAVTFNPTSGGNKSASFVVSNGGNVASAALTGIGVVPASFSISPTSKDYGSVTVMTNSAFQSFTVTNNGGTTSSAVTVALNGANSTEFNTPSSCGPIAPLGTCIIMVRFSPASVGAKAATLDVTATGTLVSAPLSGNGISVAQIATNPSSLTFNFTIEGQTDTTQTFTVINNGATTTSPLAVALSGPAAADYALAGCTGAVLMFGQTCTVTVTFSPKAGLSGGRTATATVTGNPNGGVATVGLAGTTAPALEIIAPSQAVTPFNFGTINTNCVGAAGQAAPLTAAGQRLAHAGAGGAACPTNQITIQNNTNSAQTVTVTAAGPGWPGTAPSPYQYVTRVNCAIFGTSAQFNNLAPSFTFQMQAPLLGVVDQCTISVQFAPTFSTLNTQTANVTFSIGAGGPFNTAVQAYTGSGTNASLSITPNPFDYGDVSLQSMGKSQVFTVSNQTGATTGVLQTQVGVSVDQDYHVTQDNCAGKTLANNATCTFTLLFRPLVLGAQPVTVTVRDSMGGVNTATTDIMGNGVDQAQINLTDVAGPAVTISSDFGTVIVGENSDAPGCHTITVTNEGSSDSAAITITNTGAASGFNITNGAGTDCMSGVTRLGANHAVGGAGTVANCLIRMRYSPTGAHVGITNQTGVLTVSAPALMGGTATSNLKGKSKSAFHLTMATANYGDVVLGRTADLPANFVNDSTVQTITIAGIMASNPEFTVVNNTCTTPVPVSPAPGSTCTFQLRFAPAGAAGVRQDVTVSATGTNGGGLLSTAAAPNRLDTPLAGHDIQGNGRSKATLSFSPSSFDFGSALSGSAQPNGSFIEEFALTNTGFDTTTGPVTVNISGNLLMDYTLLAGTTGPSCGAAVIPSGAITTTGAALAGGATCFIKVQFKPLLGDNGVITGTLNASATNPGPPVYMATAAAALTGTGLANGTVTVSPTAFDFGPRAVGSMSATVTFQVTNGGGMANLSNTIPTDFIRDNTVANNCGATLGAGLSCNVGVQFKPLTAGAKNVQLVIVPGTYASLQGVGLTGANIGGLANTDFGITRINGGAKLIQVTLTNNNAGATGVITYVMSGTDCPTGNPCAQFPEPAAGDTCTALAAPGLAAGATCVISLSFKPATFGAKTATLTFTGAGTGLATPITLTGSGANDPQISVSPLGNQDDGSRAMGKQDVAPTIFTVANHINSFHTGHIGIGISGANLACTNQNGATVGYPGCDFVLTTTGVTTPCHLDTSSTKGSTGDPAGTILGDNETCNFGVLFNPLHTGLRNAFITILDTPITGQGSISGGNLSSSVSGTGTEQLTATCGVCGLANRIQLGTGAAPVDIVITNNASITSDPVEEVQSGLGTQISVLADNCIDNALPAGGTCTITVRYMPDGSAGPTNGRLTVGYYSGLGLGGITTTSPPYGVTDRFLGNTLDIRFNP